MVEEAALEMPYTGIPRIEGSNPSRSDFGFVYLQFVCRQTIRITFFTSRRYHNRVTP